MCIRDRAAGTPLTEEKCKQLAQKDSLLLVCGHYEGIDERVIEALADEEMCIRDRPGVDAGLAASIFHFGEVDIGNLKRYLTENGVPVRL